MTTKATDFQTQSTVFLSWFFSQPGTIFHPSLRLTDLRDRSAGRGIIATADITANTELFTIPRSIVISVETSRLAQKLPETFISFQDHVTNEDDPDELDNNPHDIPIAWIHLILILIYEYLNHDTSQWGPYLNILPTKPSDFDTLMFWSPAELQHLQSSHITSKIGKDSADNIFRKQVLPVVTQNSAIFYPPTTTSYLSDEEVLQIAHCMGSLIMSYAFNLQPDDDSDSSSEEVSDAIDGWKEDKLHQGTMGMVPMADMLNADAEFNAHLSHGDSTLTMTSIRNITAGEEVLNYYGPLSNAELCRRYGYTSSKHATYDVVELPWTIAKECVLEEFAREAEPDKAGLSRILEALERENDLLDEAFVLERETEGPDDSGVCSKPGTFQNPPEDLVNLIVVDIFDKLSNKMLDENDQKRRLLSIFLLMLKKRLSQYSTSLGEDKVLAIKPSGRLQMALDIIYGEKTLVQEAISWTERKLQALVDHRTSKRQSRADPPRKKQRRLR